jgi:hypothetical protein
MLGWKEVQQLKHRKKTKKLLKKANDGTEAPPKTPKEKAQSNEAGSTTKSSRKRKEKQLVDKEESPIKKNKRWPRCSIHRIKEILRV